jgi:AAA15 family ATPase/GTPase
MITEISIPNYKCFTNLHVQGINEFNVLIGKNGSGKTAFIEKVMEQLSVDKIYYISEDSVIETYDNTLDDYRLLLKNELEYDFLISLRHLMPNLRYIKIENRHIKLYEFNTKVGIPLSLLGSGMLRSFQMILTAFICQDNYLFIEEVERSLSVSLQGNLMHILIELQKSKRFQIFITTHSPEILSSIKRVYNSDTSIIIFDIEESKHTVYVETIKEGY